MIKIRVSGRNDLDLPDDMTIEYNREEDQLTFKFSSGIKSFTPNALSLSELAETIEQLRKR